MDQSEIKEGYTIYISSVKWEYVDFEWGWDKGLFWYLSHNDVFRHIILKEGTYGMYVRNACM